MKPKKSVLVAVTVPLILSCQVFGEEADCVNKAHTSAELRQCGNKIVPPLEVAVSNEFQRLTEKYHDNAEMFEMLRITRNTWYNYRNVECNFEGAATAGGQTSKALPVEGNRAVLSCAVRLLKEMLSTLERL